jgi:hypothetical protein
MAKKKTGIPTLIFILGKLLLALAHFMYGILDLYPDDDTLSDAFIQTQAGASLLLQILNNKRDIGD